MKSLAPVLSTSTEPTPIEWSTCLRRILFYSNGNISYLEKSISSQKESWVDLSGVESYSYLLSVICGLKSQVVGETQVFGQFKTFFKNLMIQHPDFYKSEYSFFQNLITDCKDLREKHIQNWGGSSYGSITRKLSLNTESVFVIGNGAFADELTSWLEQKHIITLARKPRKASEHKLSIEVFKSLSSNSLDQTLIIAAPISNSDLLPYLKTTKIKFLIDWRSEYSLNPTELEDFTCYYSFKKLLHLIENESGSILKKKDLVFRELEKKSSAWYLKSTYRPLGWDDLC